MGDQRLRARLRRASCCSAGARPTSSGAGACSSPASSCSPAASLLAALAWNEPSLIGARALQGLGAAIIAPAALSILMTTFSEGKERNIALGVWGAVGGFGAAAGVLLGGVLTDLLSWEWIFFVNIPVGIAALALAPVLLGESRDARVQGFDALGAVLVTGGLSTAVFAITQANDWGWSSGADDRPLRGRRGAARRLRRPRDPRHATR